MLNLSQISKMSKIDLPASPTYLFWTLAVCCEVIWDGRTDFSFTAKDFEKFFRSIFNNEIGLQFLINLCPCPSFQGV